MADRAAKMNAPAAIVQARAQGGSGIVRGVPPTERRPWPGRSWNRSTRRPRGRSADCSGTCAVPPGTGRARRGGRPGCRRPADDLRLRARRAGSLAQAVHRAGGVLFVPARGSLKEEERLILRYQAVAAIGPGPGPPGVPRDRGARPDRAAPAGARPAGLCRPTDRGPTERHAGPTGHSTTSTT